MIGKEPYMDKKLNKITVFVFPNILVTKLRVIYMRERFLIIDTTNWKQLMTVLKVGFPGFLLNFIKNIIWIFLNKQILIIIQIPTIEIWITIS